jgi:SulP family sulfate permease
MRDITRWLPFLNWPRATPALLRGEAVAALTVALVMVPQSVAYAGLAGMPLVTGLYATFLPALVAVLFSHSTRLSVGPSALSSLLVGASLMGLAEPGSADWVSLAVWLALLAGGVQLLVGATRGAWLLNLVSSPVLAGFSQAAALLIIASQLPALVGMQVPWRDFLREPRVDVQALAYGVGGLALLLAGRRFAPRLPMILLVVVVAGAHSAWSGYGDRGSVVGPLPRGLPTFYLPGWPGWEALASLVMPALVIALVSSLEMASSARIESQLEGRRWDADQDLVGQGLGKLASAFSGAFATSTSFSRSAITLYAGAKTGWATVIATGCVVVVLLLLTPALQHVPRAILAAVVVAAVVNLVKPRQLWTLGRIDRVEAVTAFATFGVTLLSAPRIYWGVLTGVIMGLAHFLYHRLHPRIIETGLHPDGTMRDRHLWSLPPLAPHTYALRMDSALDFGAASSFERAISEHLAAHPDVRQVCLFAQPINRIDATGVETFERVHRMLAARGIALHISGIKLPVERVLRRAGALEEGPLLQLHRTEAEAIAALQAAGQPAGPASA